ncbi:MULTISPECIES: hypothetical protein [Leuconostoc]|uniref:5'-methylthioadenosine/S-adenosylhomocysteine nucleosidase n=2 Tax=Leuconostoc kimchii TaxID=136609 RepID=D5T5K2_LEUKI|nr:MULTISPECIES: hypothetical protein [Leuconostoc]ADG41332.1 5'-methylthioadenosine/S-adenosylhomocysteine nucleosidase [Leuconostoc kimchii IMSNU 11154]AEJ30688.1 5'-methylthioadenosine/S-adenosylhomocysteine nucleosidase [Leuconostoc sp. C2]QBR47815.1 hypothetical protein EW139_06635 [Leuconostoc kimchii]
MSEELSRRDEKKAQKRREKERAQVERAYAKAHPTEITVVQPETREEMRLTRKGRYELGSDGKLTAQGKSSRLTHRYNMAIIVLLLLIVTTYAYFFLVH